MFKYSYFEVYGVFIFIHSLYILQFLYIALAVYRSLSQFIVANQYNLPLSIYIFCYDPQYLSNLSLYINGTGT